MLKHINVFEYIYWRWKIKGGIEGGRKDIRKGENNCLWETEGTAAREKVNERSRLWGCNSFPPPGGSGLRLSQLVFVTPPNQILKCVFSCLLGSQGSGGKTGKKVSLVATFRYPLFSRPASPQNTGSEHPSTSEGSLMRPLGHLTSLCLPTSHSK